MIKAIIFDCFGVLVGRGFNETYRMAGGDSSKDQVFIEDLFNKTNLGLISEKQFHDAISLQLGISLEQYAAVVKRAEQPNIELLKYIETLRPRFKTAVLSNANVGIVDKKVGKEWIERCFDATIVSAEVGAMKPDPRIYELTAEKLDVQMNECIFVDDREGYCHAARNVGMQAILYRSFRQMKQELEQILAC